MAGNANGYAIRQQHHNDTQAQNHNHQQDGEVRARVGPGGPENSDTNDGDVHVGNFDENLLSRFLEDDDHDFPSIIRLDSTEIIYANDSPHGSFIGENQKYLKGELLGEGSYSKVKEVLDMETLCRRAIKIVKWRKIRRIPNGIANVKREINIMKRLKHRNVIRLVEEFFNEEKQKRYIVLEYCCCNLQAMLDECEAKMFPEWQAHYYFTQLVDGLEYLHSKGIIHKDIKPANLLLTVDQVLKITDLGVSEELDRFAKDDTITTSQGSPVSQSPEIAAGDESFSGYKIDIWSCGITLFRMCTDAYPFEGENVYKLYDNIAKAEYSIPDHLSDHLKVLIRGMLAKTSDDRYSIASIRNTDWFKQQKPLVGKSVSMPAPADNKAFAMTTLASLKALVLAENHHSPLNDSNGSENEVVIGATECYNISNSAAVSQDNSHPTVAVPEPRCNHITARSPSHRKHKKCLVS